MPNLANRILQSIVLIIAACASAFAGADYVDDWGPAIGSEMPEFELADSKGELRDRDSLATPSGLLLFFNRSADW